MHDYTPEAARAIEARHRQFTHRLRVDWNGNGDYDHVLSDLSQYVTDSSRDQTLTGTAPEELMLVEGSAAAKIDFELSGNYGGRSLVTHFSPFHPYSVFYANGIESCIGVDMEYSISVLTDNGWEEYKQFTGVIRDVDVDRAAGTVSLSCLDNVEKMRTPMHIPAYAVYEDYLQEGAKRSGLVDSSSVIDLAARSADFSSGPRGYDHMHKQHWQTSNQTYAQMNVLKVPFHGSMLPEIGALDNEFEFHLTERWELGDANHRSRAEQFTAGPWGNLALAAVPKGEGSYTPKKYWMDFEELYNGSHPVGTTILGTWIYWTGQNQDAYSVPIMVEMDRYQLEMHVRPSDSGVFPILRTGKDSPNSTPTATATGPLMHLGAPGWYYVEVAGHHSGGTLRLRTAINEQHSPVTTHHSLPNSHGEYRFSGLVTIHNDYAMSDAVVVRSGFQQTSYIENSRYNHSLYGNAALDWGRNRITFTVRELENEAWDVAKEVASAEYGAVFFDEDGAFRFWNYDTVMDKQSTSVRRFSLDDVEGLSLNVTLDSVRNVWRAETRTGQARMGITYDFSKDGVPFDESPEHLPAKFNAYQGQWVGFFFADDDHVVSTHTSIDLRRSTDHWDEHAPLQGMTPYQGDQPVTDVTNIQVYPRKFGKQWTKVVMWLHNPSVIGWMAPSDNIKRFRIAGTIIQENEPRSFEIRNDDSVGTYGQRVIELRNNFWLQDEFQTRRMLEGVVQRIGRPIPVTDAITVPGDPRVQIGDTITVDDPDGVGPSLNLQVLGIRRDLNAGAGLTDTYKVEAIRPAGQWLLGDEFYSELGTSTIL